MAFRYCICHGSDHTVAVPRYAVDKSQQLSVNGWRSWVQQTAVELIFSCMNPAVYVTNVTVRTFNYIIKQYSVNISHAHLYQLYTLTEHDHSRWHAYPTAVCRWNTE